MKKVAGILGLLLGVCVLTALLNPQFATANNLQNIVRWTALFGILSIGVAFPIITGGIDLSIGSVVGLIGCLLPWLLVVEGWSPAAAVAVVLLVAAGLGLVHGLLITRLRLQPFVVTLCGLLFYRGLARWWTNDQNQGFGIAHDGLRTLATGKPLSMALLVLLAGGLLAGGGWLWRARTAALAGAALALAGGAVWALELQPFAGMLAPAPFLVMLAIAVAAAIFLGGTVWGRYLFALGRNEQAARYSGIDTGAMVVLAYVLSALLAGAGGVLFALDINSIQPATHGNVYELYAIAAAVLGGCSLRGGEGTILGVVIGTAVMQVLRNAINLLAIPTQLELAIIGGVILLGVMADEVLRRWVGGRRA